MNDDFYVNTVIEHELKRMGKDIIFTYGILSWADNSYLIGWDKKKQCNDMIECVYNPECSLNIADGQVYTFSHSALTQDKFNLTINQASEAQWKFLSGVSNSVLPIHMLIANYVTECILSNEKLPIYDDSSFIKYIRLAMSVAGRRSCIPNLLLQHPSINQDTIGKYVVDVLTDYDELIGIYNFLLGGRNEQNT